MSFSLWHIVLVGGSETWKWSEAAGLHWRVQEIPACLQVFLHGTISRPRSVDGETAGVHSQCGHLLHRYGPRRVLSVIPVMLLQRVT